MKFLAFNILVGGALAWLVLGGGAIPGLLNSTFSSLASVQTASAECPVDQTVAAVQGATVESPAIAPVLVSERDETTSADQAAVDQKVLASSELEPRLPVSVSASQGSPAAPESVHTGPITAPPSQAATRPSPGRRDALVSLAESMELFSLERIAK
jgi:hypothetical protein